MKRLLLLLGWILLISGSGIAQNWTITTEDGLSIKAVSPDGKKLEVVAVLDEGDDCFMDVKAVDGNRMHPAKLILSSQMYIPVAAVASNGTTYPLVAIDATGAELEVNGVSRFGNTIKLAAITPGGDFKEILAKSTDGRTKSIAGVKFLAENIETTIRNTDVVAHVKALPTPNIKTEERAWDIIARTPTNKEYEVVALNKNGKEYAVKALSAGGSFMILDVKAVTGREESSVKLLKKDKGIFMTGIDEFGRKFPVKIKIGDGSYVDIEAGVNCGKTIDILAEAADGTSFTIHAKSPEMDIYDVKGIKILDRDNEGIIQGLKGLVPFYGHVKALPPVEPVQNH